MSTTRKQNVGEDQYLDKEVFVLCWEITIGTECPNIYSSFLVINSSSAKEGATTSGSNLQKIFIYRRHPK